MITGRCECRLVRYEADGEITDFSHCHCSQCRRLHGATYASFAGVAKDSFRYLSGENDVKIFMSSAGVVLHKLNLHRKNCVNLVNWQIAMQLLTHQNPN